MKVKELQVAHGQIPSFIVTIITAVSSLIIAILATVKLAWKMKH